MPKCFKLLVSLILSLTLVGNFAFAEPRTTITEDDVVDRVLTMAPDTLKARERLGEVEANVMTTKSIFDTYLSSKADISRDKFEQSSNFFGTRTDRANWDIGLSKKLPFGMQAGFNWTNERDRTFGQPTIGGVPIFPTAPTFDSRVNLTASQPVMKNFFGMVDRGYVAQSKKAYESADLSTQYQIATIAYRGLLTYWQWVIAYSYMNAWSEMIGDAQHFLNVTLERERLGTAEETDILAARANLINRRNGLLKARRTAIELEKDLKVLLGISEEEDLNPNDKKPHKMSGFYTSKFEAIDMALANRWDYQAQKKDVERLNIKVVSAKNERWPELDLLTTLAANGLDTNYGRTMDDVNHPYWMVGAQLSIPLENRSARGNYKKARHEKATAVIELKNMENKISNQIDELLKRLKVDGSVLTNYQAAERLQRKKLSEEMVKYGYGRSNSELVIIYQNDRLSAQLQTLNAWADYITTVMDLRLAQNTLIE